MWKTRQKISVYTRIFSIVYRPRVYVLQAAANKCVSFVATMKTIRRVKTVFVIFVSFVSCWTPYIVVVLYDSSDTLPLPVHLYASMLAHLHASLNFAIYGLMNADLRASFTARLLAHCRRIRQRTRDN